MEVEECVKQLKASKEEVEPMKVEYLIVENAKRAPHVLQEGGEIQTLPELK